MLNYDDIKTEYKLMRDRGDPWGSAMGAWFDLAAELEYRYGETPSEWQYVPPATAGDPREEDSAYFDLFQDASREALVQLGNLLSRYATMLRRAGMDY